MDNAFKKALKRTVAEVKRAKDVYEVNPKGSKPDFYVQRVGSGKTVGTTHDKIPDKGLPSTYIGIKVKKGYDPELVKIGMKGHKLTGKNELRGMGTAQQFVRAREIKSMDFDYPSEGMNNKNAQAVLSKELEELNRIKQKEVSKLKQVSKLSKALVKQQKRPQGKLKRIGGGSSSGIRGGGIMNIPTPKLKKD